MAANVQLDILVIIVKQQIHALKVQMEIHAKMGALLQEQLELVVAAVH